MSSQATTAARAGKLPSKLYGFEVLDFIGEGAGSYIYAAADSSTNQLYALKHVVITDDKSVRFFEQLQNEFEVSRGFRHDGLRRSIDMKVTKTIFRKVVDAILVMELFDGIPLDRQLPPDLADLLECFAATARALGALHAQGYIHCDLKPNNILLGPGGQVKVIDFGQACRGGTVKQRIQGTPDFISPEQVKCEPVSARTDVFNLGATMYWSLGGRKLPTLFTVRKGKNSFLLEQAIPAPMELNPLIPEALSNLVMSCVKANAAKRPSDMNEIAVRLDTIAHGVRRRVGKRSA